MSSFPFELTLRVGFISNNLAALDRACSGPASYFRRITRAQLTLARATRRWISCHQIFVDGSPCVGAPPEIGPWAGLSLLMLSRSGYRSESDAEAAELERIAYRINQWWLRNKKHVDLSDLFHESNTVHLTDETIFPSIAVYVAQQIDANGSGSSARILIPTAVLHHYLNEKNWAGMHPRLHLEMSISDADLDDHDTYNPEFWRIYWLDTAPLEAHQSMNVDVHRTREVWELFQYWSGADV